MATTATDDARHANVVGIPRGTVLRTPYGPALRERGIFRIWLVGIDA